MKQAPNCATGLKSMRGVVTTGDLRATLSTMLMGLALREYTADEATAGARLGMAIVASVDTEIKLALAADQLRERGQALGKISHIGQTVISNTSSHGEGA